MLCPPFTRWKSHNTFYISFFHINRQIVITSGLLSHSIYPLSRTSWFLDDFTVFVFTISFVLILFSLTCCWNGIARNVGVDLGLPRSTPCYTPPQFASIFGRGVYWFENHSPHFRQNARDGSFSLQSGGCCPKTWREVVNFSRHAYGRLTSGKRGRRSASPAARGPAYTPERLKRAVRMQHRHFCISRQYPVIVQFSEKSI